MKNSIKPNSSITYSLRAEKKKSDFYTELNEYRKSLINSAKIQYFGAVTAYQNYIKEKKIETPRQWEEYFLELLMLGVFWNTYSPYISSKSKYFKFLFDSLYYTRSKNKTLKPHADKARGYLATVLLRKRGNKILSFDLKNIKSLLSWMDCTKEFTEETKRLNNWILFFKLNPEVFLHIQKTLNGFTKNFQKECNEIFGDYTNNVKNYLVETHPKNKYKENYFFTGRKEVEYHLNMVGASILNEALKDQFQNTNKQVVLLPTCMSSGKPCKAKIEGLEMVCTHCTGSCNVSKISKELSKKAIRTVLIPHSSKFSEFLKQWANQQETGLIGVACVLNLLKGGYELIDLNIPSQCVFLDYCGCKKHWSKQGIPTDLNIDQLKKILKIESEDIKTVSS